MNPERKTGTYALVMRSDRSKTVAIGRLGTLRLIKGYYIYIGSAFGPGGVPARIRHHLGFSARPHWHVDYLRPNIILAKIWATHDPAPREHQWAQVFADWRGASVPLPGFGASDCHCQSHLFFLPRQPDINHFRRRAAVFSSAGIVLLRESGASTQ